MKKRQIVKGKPFAALEGDDIKVQMNLWVPRWQRAHLTKVAKESNVSLASLVSETLNKAYPMVIE